MAEPAPATPALSGVAAAAVAVGLTQLVAAPLGRGADALNAVGSAVIDLTPGPVKEWAIRTFGTADKVFLSVAVVAVIVVIAAAAGRMESRARPAGSAVFVAAGIAGCAAIVSRAGARPVDIIPTVIGALCGVAVLRLLAGKRRAGRPDTATADIGRRRWLTAFGLLCAGLLTGLAGGVLTRRLHSVSGERQAFALPPVNRPAPPVPSNIAPTGVALPSFITSNDNFYRIDTALLVPQVSRNDWRLTIHGMVDHEVTYSFDDLRRFEVIEKVVTLTCVSNPVGGDLISNARWTGYRVRDLLARAGVHRDADMVLSTSVDGFTAGTPVEVLTDRRDALLAITMNGEPLPVDHGYPARLVVPGLYGYVSATKWLTDLEVTRFDRAQAYWTKLGWSAHGPIKTESRIDVPRSGQRIAAGPVTSGGVAWAQERGVRAVEVRIDDGPWQPAELGASYSNDTWRLWAYRWTATPGPHSITVRATDNTGAVQTGEGTGVMPDGATGWHTVAFMAA
ncbi:MAG: molybdopterin-dependent oxidoreductase [Mycobacteriaceae bacterium]|nr:molybdopterin-dependent oxidoreductase [Mycobacteriaceae bacterium]